MDIFLRQLYIYTSIFKILNTERDKRDILNRENS